jgi:hypothetical protein
MNEWVDGIEYNKDVPLREIVQPNAWSSTVWISPVGEAYRKYYNPVLREWGEWESVPISLESSGRVGFALSTWASVEACVAKAWLHKAPGSKAHVRILDPANALDVRNIAWNEPEHDSEGGDFTGERWKPLRWYCGMVECDVRYQISSHGRLKNPQGGITRGFAMYETRWAAVKGCGLVNLMAASGLVRNDVPLQPRVYKAYCSLSSGLHPTEHATRWQLSDKAAWQYYSLAAPLVQGLRAIGHSIVSPELWSALEALQGDPLLGGRLTELHEEMIGEVPMEELRFARTCILSE